MEEPTAEPVEEVEEVEGAPEPEEVDWQPPDEVEEVAEEPPEEQEPPVVKKKVSKQLASLAVAQCAWVFESGKNKGERCKAKAVGGTWCGAHARTKRAQRLDAEAAGSGAPPASQKAPKASTRLSGDDDEPAVFNGGSSIPLEAVGDAMAMSFWRRIQGLEGSRPRPAPVVEEAKAPAKKAPAKRAAPATKRSGVEAVPAKLAAPGPANPAQAKPTEAPVWQAEAPKVEAKVDAPTRRKVKR